ncbi:MAG: hypothetical protein M5U28_32585 [Sandaracinaceae bacterium]|nr:hypothetical protein [Sandaracinaceae bacterium]
MIASVPHPARLVASYLRHPSQLARSWYIGFFQLPRLPERALDAGLVERLWRAWSPGYDPPRDHLREVARTLARSEHAPLGAYRALARSLALEVPRWPRIRVPTLYLHGARDGCLAPEIARGQERAFEGPHREERVDAGHFAPLEAPERVAELALAWISERGADAPRPRRKTSVTAPPGTASAMTSQRASSCARMRETSASTVAALSAVAASSMRSRRRRVSGTVSAKNPSVKPRLARKRWVISSPSRSMKEPTENTSTTATKASATPQLGP